MSALSVPLLLAELDPRVAYALEGADWLTSDLLDDGGRAHLLEWARRGMPCAKVSDVRVFGDTVAAPHVARALGALPPPTLSLVARECSIVVLGMRGAFGICMRLPSPTTLLAVTRRSPEWIVGTTLHEVSHAWRALGDCGGSLTVADEAGLRERAAEEGWSATVDAAVAADESAADRLAALWMKRLYGADYDVTRGGLRPTEN